MTDRAREIPSDSTGIWFTAAQRLTSRRIVVRDPQLSRTWHTEPLPMSRTHRSVLFSQVVATRLSQFVVRDGSTQERFRPPAGLTVSA
ncbi:hypothetical protein BGK67_30645 [Streptomyces subrutilus]|uniref:Uncharacterized protein n=1 Tax=Streptomyces subrutilus TaxID=36818 RepID=A0A1E5PZX3_9ACTN|nr:hypothetical protein BGK67_30645 [Streptomyces subrutilus]